MAKVIFTDGTLLEADSWQSLEKELRADSWNPGGKSEFREEMARRAWVWSRSALLTEGTCKRFFESLEDAGMLRIVEEEAE